MTREELLHRVITLKGSLDDNLKQLGVFGWDSEEALVTLTRQDVISVLTRYISAALSARAVKEWASALECREDVGYENGYRDILMSAVHALANPYLEGELTLEFAKKTVSGLK